MDNNKTDQEAKNKIWKKGDTIFYKKEVLGIWIGENESAKYWLGTLNELKNRGVKDILIICSDGLKGINEAIKAVYPNVMQYNIPIIMDI